MKKLLSFLLVMALFLSGCNLLPDPNTNTAAASDITIWAMDTQMDLRLYGDGDGAVMTALINLLNGLSRDLSAADDSGALYELNSTGRSEDARLFTLAKAGLEVSAQTGGALDLTLLPVSRRWGFVDQAYREEIPALPGPEELEALRESVGMDKLHCENGVVTLTDGAVLDLGALGKGYAADLCRERMEEAGVPGILSLGGNIQTVGTKPDGSDWIIGVQDPDDAGSFALTLRLEGSKAVVTSGDYQRYYELDGLRYCHILDPEDLSPVQGSLRSVTVVAEQGLRADALSTALFVLGREAGAELWRSLGDFEAVWIEADGTVWLTPGLKDLAQGAEFEVLEP